MATEKTSDMSYAWLLLIIPVGYWTGSFIRSSANPCRCVGRMIVDSDPRGSDGTFTSSQVQATYNQVNQNQNPNPIENNQPNNNGNGGNRFDQSDPNARDPVFNV